MGRAVYGATLPKKMRPSLEQIQKRTKGSWFILFNEWRIRSLVQGYACLKMRWQRNVFNDGNASSCVALHATLNQSKACVLTVPLSPMMTRIIINWISRFDGRNRKANENELSAWKRLYVRAWNTFSMMRKGTDEKKRRIQGQTLLLFVFPSFFRWLDCCFWWVWTFHVYEFRGNSSAKIFPEGNARRSLGVTSGDSSRAREPEPQAELESLWNICKLTLSLREINAKAFQLRAFQTLSIVFQGFESFRLFLKSFQLFYDVVNGLCRDFAVRKKSVEKMKTELLRAAQENKNSTDNGVV